MNRLTRARRARHAVQYAKREWNKKSRIGKEPWQPWGQTACRGLCTGCSVRFRAWYLLKRIRTQGEAPQKSRMARLGREAGGVLRRSSQAVGIKALLRVFAPAACCEPHSAAKWRWLNPETSVHPGMDDGRIANAQTQFHRCLVIFAVSDIKFAQGSVLGGSCLSGGAHAHRLARAPKVPFCVAGLRYIGHKRVKNEGCSNEEYAWHDYALPWTFAPRWSSVQVPVESCSRLCAV